MTPLGYTRRLKMLTPPGPTSAAMINKMIPQSTEPEISTITPMIAITTAMIHNTFACMFNSFRSATSLPAAPCPAYPVDPRASARRTEDGGQTVQSWS